MLFDRYGEVLARLEEMGARVGKLNNRDRQVMQNLFEEQEWLSATLVKRARFLLEEIDRSFEKLFDWMIAFSDLIDRASGQGGTPGEVLRMERIMQEADDLREQLNRLVPDRKRVEGGPAVMLDETADGVPDGRSITDVHSVPAGDRAAGYRKEVASAAMPGMVLDNTAAPLLSRASTEPETARTVLPVAPVLKKTGKKDRKKDNPGGERTRYAPPPELLAALEKKMAAACGKPKTHPEIRRSD